MDKSQQDSFYVDVALPYESNTYRPFTDANNLDHRLLGSATYDSGSQDLVVTPGGRLNRRGPFTALSNSVLSGYRIDRQWHYETLPNTDGTVYRYILISALNAATGLYAMFYSLGSSFTAFTSIRDINASRVPHILTVLRGKAYIEGFPAAASAEKLGTIIFDGSAGTPTYQPWGLVGPTVSLKMSGWTGFLTADVTDSGTSLSVSAVSAPPATPFVVRIGTEIMNCTAKAGAGPYTLTVTRGYSGSKAVAHKTKDRVLYYDWTASDHKVSVNLSWKYTYCYKSITGQYSNIVAAEANPDLNQSETFAFADLIPKMTVQGTADTTNVPSIVIFRSTDGGGTFYELETISNTGAGSITYEDKSYASGATSTTHNDPVPDNKLDTTKIAPTLVSNSPPPTVNEPLVVGTDTPTVACSNLETFQSRIFKGVGNILYASASEEVKLGNPEESFKLGRNGTYWKIPYAIISIRATSQALYVLTSGYTYMLTGSNLESFNLQQIGTDTPMTPYDRAASCTFLDRVAFISSGNKVCVISGTTVDIISECLQGIPDRGLGRQMAFLSDAETQWLIVFSTSQFGPGTGSTNASKVYIYDWKRSSDQRRDFWFAPWYTYSTAISTGMLPGTYTFSTLSASQSLFYFFGAAQEYLTSASAAAGITYYASKSSVADSVIYNGAYLGGTFYPIFKAFIGPMKNPVGNHINLHALPQLTTVLTDIRLDYHFITAPLDGYTTNPQLYIAPDLDDLELAVTGSGYQATMTKPDRRESCLGTDGVYISNYQTRVAHCYIATQDWMLVVQKGSDMAASQALSLMRIAVTTAPDSGEGQ